VRCALAVVVVVTACGRIDFDTASAPDAVVLPTALQCEACTVDANCLVGGCTGGLCRLKLEIAIDWHADCHVGTDPVSSWTVKATNVRAGSYTITAIPSAGSFGPSVMLGWKFEPWCAGLDLSALATASFATPQEVEQALSTAPIVEPFPGGDLRCASYDSACDDNSGDNRFAFADSCP
jgi:hypothetical protein